MPPLASLQDAWFVQVIIFFELSTDSISQTFRLVCVCVCFALRMLNYREDGLVALQPEALSAFFGDIRSAITQIQKSLDRLDRSVNKSSSKPYLARLNREQRLKCTQIWLMKVT